MYIDGNGFVVSDLHNTKDEECSCVCRENRQSEMMPRRSANPIALNQRNKKRYTKLHNVIKLRVESIGKMPVGSFLKRRLG